MGFSEDWDQRYKENTHMSSWPWSDMVSYVMRYAQPKEKEFKVLELGCGAGANIPFFLSLNIEYFGIDGSPKIIDILKKKFPSISENLIVGDFTKEISFKEYFDLIVDRAAITCNSTDSIKNCLKLIYEKLKVGGKYIGIDLYSVSDSEYHKGVQAEDEYTRNNFKNGPFLKTGRVHFFEKQHLLDLFSDFEILKLEHKKHTSEIPKNEHNFASWNIIAQKSS